MRFLETHDAISYLHDYYPVRYSQHKGISEQILAFKKGDDNAVRLFANEMKEAMDERFRGYEYKLSEMIVCIMPSHIAGQYSSGLRRLAAYLTYNYGMIDGSNLIKRVKSHERISHGGKRSVLSHLDTMAISTDYVLEGKDILVLDDVTTTGNSIEAVRRLLCQYNVGKVYAQTIGKTYGEESAHHMPLDWTICDHATVLVPPEDNQEALAVNKNNEKTEQKPKLQRVEYDGETYIYRNGKWLTSSYVAAPLSIIGTLNKMIESSEDFENMSIPELKEIIKKARDGENYKLAEKLMLIAMEKGNLSDISSLLPILTSNYRRLGNPQKAIETADEYISLYGREIHSSALWTSVGAAYADLEDFSQAKYYADRAFAMSKGKGSPELSGLYARIKSKSE